MRRYILLFIALCLYVATRGQTIGNLDLSGLPQPTQTKAVRSWIDDDADSMQIFSDINGIHTIDLSSLPDGLHTIHFQIIDSEDKAAAPYSAIFLKIGKKMDDDTVTAEKLVYWFDDEETTTVVDMVSGITSIDASKLLDGLHTIHYMVVCSDGSMTSAISSIFLKMNAIPTTAQSLRYWFDNEMEAKKISVVDGTQNIDVSDLLAGLHTLHYQLVDNDGEVSPPISDFFLKKFDKPVEDGQNGITMYQYWLNDNSKAMQTVTLEEATNPYTLIALLPMQKEPFRSSSFLFEIKDGQPMAYAKNDFHIRFHDAANYWADESKQFIDYSISQNVEPVQSLEDFVGKVSLSKPAPNDIIWYTMQSAPGDTAAFKVSQPATVQVFAPSGAEVFKTSEYESVSWGGVHTWEDGTYYLAVHDVTGSQNTMMLEYMHMDKYDVVDWDVHTVGNGGCSTITFKGNGFRNLYAVDLVIAPGDTIHSFAVSHDSDAETEVTFDFTDATLGEYNAVFHFTEEEKFVIGVVKVEEAKGIELVKTVNFPSAFPHGLSTTYTLKITNNGNMTAYSVPVYTWIMNKGDKDAIYHIEYEGLNLPGILDGVDLGAISEREKTKLQTMSDEIGDAHYFMMFRAESEESPGDSVWVRSNYFFTNIAPYETKSLLLTISANEGVWAYFTVPEEWPVYSSIQEENGTQHGRVLFGSPSVKEQYCCIRDRVECIANIISDATGIANKISEVLAPGTPVDIALGAANCLADAISKIVSATGKVMCGDEEKEKNIFESIKEVTNAVSIVGTLTSCTSKLLPTGKIKGFLEGVSNMLEGKGFVTAILVGDDISDCINAFSNPIPDCPSCIDCSNGGACGGGSWDPNDIFGYLSEAGSKFIADTVKKVNYAIEFENDTTLAMAAAHSIAVKDTLDSRYFDLSTFVPTKVKIGNHEVFLTDADIFTASGKTSFVKTIDMRPAIYSIAQVEGTFSQMTGIAEWRFTSLDPMTMELAEDVHQGILPVNIDGKSGIGEVMFEIGLKLGKGDGTELRNRASIVFDANSPILTPTWTNIVDAVAPNSRIDNSWMENDSTLRITAEGFDARSGVWKYTWYVQAGENAPWWKEGETESPQFDYHIYEGIDYGFCVLATDSAGNVEQKVIERERGFKTYGQEFEDGISPLPTFPESEGSWYDLSGRQIGNDKSSNGKYPKGVIIRNRKKTLVTE